MDTSGTSSVGVDAAQESQDADVTELIAELRPTQRVVLDDLVRGVSVKAAAEKAGVHRGTVSRWILTDAHFIAALNAVELEIIRVGHNRLLSLIPAALAALEEAVEAGNLHAALQVLKNTLFARRAVSSISPKVIAKELEVAALQHEVALHKQQTDILVVREETIKRHESVEHARRWRICEDQRKAAENEEGRLRWEAQEAAERQAQQAAQQFAAEAQKQKTAEQKPVDAPIAQPANPPKKPGESASSLPAAKHPGQSNAPARDARIAAAAKAAVSTLSTPANATNQAVSSAPSSTDPSRSFNPGLQANS